MKLSSEKLIEYFKNYFDNSDIINKFLEKTSFIETNIERVANLILRCFLET